MAFDDTRIAARPVLEPRADFAEQLGDCITVGQARQGQTPGVERTLLCQRDEFFHEGPNLFRLFDRCNDTPVLEQSACQVALEGQTMGSVSAQLAAGF
jgi:hypothetical protein